jgi:hypothetical protein
MTATIRSMTCSQCNERFDWPVRRSRPPKYCGPICYRLANNAHARKRGAARAHAELDLRLRRKQARMRAATAKKEIQAGERRFVARRRFRARSCEYCNASFSPATLVQRYCDEQCRNRHKSQMRKVDPAVLCPVAYRECLTCFKLFASSAHQNRRRCSQTCEVAWLRETKQRRPADLNVEQLGDRDAWRCHLCDRPVPRRKFAGHPLDPTIDHLIPVSAGGTGAAENLALAHLGCNSRRGANGPAQLRLIG